MEKRVKNLIAMQKTHSYKQGCAQKSGKGGGAHFEAKLSQPDIVMGKKGHHARRLSFLRISPLLSAFACDGGVGGARGTSAPSLGAPLTSSHILDMWTR